MDNKLYVVKHIIHPLAYLCLVCYTISHMSEARNVIILILVLLFIFVGVGVAISRLNKSESATKTKSPGFLSRIFSDLKDPISTPSGSIPTVTPRPTSDTPLTFIQPSGVPTPTAAPITYVIPDGQNGTNVVQAAPTPSTQKGGNAEQIPATGAPTWVLLAALGGLISGVKLYRRV